LNAADLVAALELPLAARVDQRVTKKLLLEHAPTAADKRRIADGVEEVRWIAALKPTTVGVPALRDDLREYLEIAVLEAIFARDAQLARLVEVLHRAIPYPLVLVASQSERSSLSLAHKRWSQIESGATVLDGGVVAEEFDQGGGDDHTMRFLAGLALAQQPRTHLFVLYQSWIDRLVALRSARVTGTFCMADSPDHAAARHDALRECARLDAEIQRLRTAAKKERQMARQVELNLEVKRLERLRAEAAQNL
jgi:hypothetical protein